MPMKLNEYPAVKVGIFDSGHEDFELKMAANVDPRDAYPENRIFFSLPDPRSYAEIVDSDSSCIPFSMTPEAALEHVKRVQQAVVDVKLAAGGWETDAYSMCHYRSGTRFALLMSSGVERPAVMFASVNDGPDAGRSIRFTDSHRSVDLSNVCGWRLA